MKINEIQIRDFRNLRQIDYIAHPGLNLFLGRNAQGKTNLLEAIYILACSGSFRTGSDNDLPFFESSGYLLKTNYHQANRSLTGIIKYDRNNGKVLIINNKKADRNNPDRLKVVLFTPDDLYLVKGSPHKRRAFLNFVLKQISPDYVYNLDNYNRILKKRNFLLKQDKTKGNTFEAVNEVFIETAARVILARINFVHFLEEMAAPLYGRMNNQRGTLKLRYALSFPVDNGKINLEILQNTLARHIQMKHEEEMRKKTTRLGPHLDDLHLYHDNRMARFFASQGQQRNIAVALKMAELYTFKKIKGFYPVLLLDEVLAELDEEKKNLWLDYLQNADFQSFMTSISLPGRVLNATRVSWIENGELRKRG